MARLPYRHPTSEQVSVRMRANRRTDTKPEVAVGSALHRLGLRVRKHHPIRLPDRLVKPDVVFTRQKVAVFVDGCFWHGCPEHGTTPKANSDYWKPKLERNKVRDREVDPSLTAAGWTVVRVWEHDEPAVVAAKVRSVVAKQSKAS